MCKFVKKFLQTCYKTGAFWVTKFLFFFSLSVIFRMVLVSGCRIFFQLQNNR